MEEPRDYGSEQQILFFLQSLYAGTSYRVKVGDRQSEVMNVNVGHARRERVRNVTVVKWNMNNIG